MNQTLTGEFGEEEVLAALKQMAPMKAPGPDGMPPLFFQHFWNIVESDVTSSILSWLNSGILPHPLNHTFVALIPKIKNPEHVHQFKAVIQALPTYTMGCFKIPLGLCYDIESLIKKFWWGQRGD